MPASIQLAQGDPADQPHPQTGHTSICVTSGGGLALVQPDGSVTVLESNSPGFSAGVNSNGSTEIAIGSALFLSVLTLVGGSPRTLNIILDLDEAEDGWQVAVNVNWPDVAGFVLNFRNGSSGGALLASFQTPGDGVTLNGEWAFYFSGGAWAPRYGFVPARS